MSYFIEREPEGDLVGSNGSLKKNVKIIQSHSILHFLSGLIRSFNCFAFILKKIKKKLKLCLELFVL
jgi:hypothetical protein